MIVDQPVKKSRLKTLRLPILIVSATVVTIFLLMATRPRMLPVSTPEQVWPVEVIKAQFGAQQPELKLFGEVIAGRRSELRPLVSGLIIEIGPNFRNGGIVRKGELLVLIDPFDYETGLRHLHGEGVDVVVVDARSLTDQIRQLVIKVKARTEAPIVVLSDEYDSKAIRRLSLAGVALHLSKPAATSTVSEAITEVGTRQRGH